MEKSTAPDPKRFETFTELANGKGFTINGSKHVFYYDKYHGWRDEYGNYYNADGEPESEPESESDKSVSEGNWSGDEDEYEKEFGPQEDIEDDFEKGLIISESAQISITKNIEELSLHNKEGPLRVNFEIIDIDEEEELPSIKSVYQAYSKRVKGVINVFYDKDENGKEIETGYFVMKNLEEATKLIKLENENVIGYDVSFHVEAVEVLEDDPISKQETEKLFTEFINIDQGEKLFIIKLENNSGFTCDKKVFNNWIKGIVSKFDLVKMRKCNNGGKQPIIKITEAEAEKLRKSTYENKKIELEEYVAKIENEEKTEEKVEGKPEEEENNGKVE